jgi:glucose dehydrogenase
MGTTMASPASLYKDVLITPATSPVIRAWNVRTGALVWKFDLVAQPGDPNHKTWEGESWQAIGRHEHVGLSHDRHRARHCLRAGVDCR